MDAQQHEIILYSDVVFLEETSDEIDLILQYDCG